MLLQTMAGRPVQGAPDRDGVFHTITPPQSVGKGDVPWDCDTVWENMPFRFQGIMTTYHWFLGPNNDNLDGAKDKWTLDVFAANLNAMPPWFTDELNEVWNPRPFGGPPYQVQFSAHNSPNSSFWTDPASNHSIVSVHPRVQLVVPEGGEFRIEWYMFNFDPGVYEWVRMEDVDLSGSSFLQYTAIRMLFRWYDFDHPDWVTFLQPASFRIRLQARVVDENGLIVDFVDYVYTPWELDDPGPGGGPGGS
jgi:hypothetical protein